ncbi:AraC family transcriptional regulator [Janthinobacterium sp. UMAB-56]|uniref:AraC family transcriptional regulator n=1 Tax=Janthinobacterium sp. UMAB-56 TaxID=1365361 RepID=UPI001C5818DA|nr:AraC family transcriptional regulator [Janthinobacterium sp. UMAB-56]
MKALDPAVPHTCATLAQLREEAFALFQGLPQEQRDLPTALPYLSLIRFTQTTELHRGMLEPSMCLVLQGAKTILIGKEITSYGAGSYVVSAIDLPVSGQVTQASRQTPYLGLRIALDARELAALVIDMQLAVPDSRRKQPAAYVEQADTHVQDALLRLLRMLDKPRDLAALGPLLKQEILYRLLTARGGAALYESVTAHAQEKGVSEAMLWIKHHYNQPLNIGQLAKSVSMSVSSLHHRFKALAVMSPLQYQKQIRLLEARKLLLTGKLEAASVAFQVGYESPSQFSREYRRLFGAPPLQDMEYLKHHEPSL